MSAPVLIDAPENANEVVFGVVRVKDAAEADFVAAQYNELSEAERPKFIDKMQASILANWTPETDVALDFDDTLGDFLGLWAEEIGKAFDKPKQLGTADWDNYYLPTFFENETARAGLTLPSGRLTKGGEKFCSKAAEANENTISIYEFLSPAIYDRFQIYAHTLEAVRQITSIPGVVAKIISAHLISILHNPELSEEQRIAGYEEKKKGIVRERLSPYLKDSDIVFTSDKTKWGHALADDAISNTNKFPGLPILLKKPWNKNEVPTNINAVRVENLLEAIPHINRLAKEKRRAFQETAWNLRRDPVQEIEIPAKSQTQNSEPVR